MSQGFVFKLWHDLLTLTAIVSDPESSKEYVAHIKLPFSLKGPPVPQERQKTKQNLENKRIKAQWPCHRLLHKAGSLFHFGTLPDSYCTAKSSVYITKSTALCSLTVTLLLLSV